ncbi:MAG: hypothetical protein KAI66_07800 [Lentisphaeria bacterium]|nr:hypothetical protein [Lentisphaeria bacterium]
MKTLAVLLMTTTCFLPLHISTAAEPKQPAAKKPFHVPKATIVTDPAFRSHGTWGGKSDGKTIGSDGKPLAAHRIYANDSHYFLTRLATGEKKLLSQQARSRLADLAAIHMLQDKQKKASRIKIKSANLTQHDGRKLSEITLSGWVVAKHLKMKNR